MQIQNIGGQLVVDSRIIADELGITHKAFKETVRENQTDIEEAFGKVALETAPSSTSNQSETIYFLNEDQATYLMTLSRNTDQVKKAKLNLVKAFSTAKSAIQNQQQDMSAVLQMLQEMQNKLTQQELNMQLLTARTQRLDELEQHERDFNEAASIHPGCAEILIDQIEADINQQTMSTKEWLDYLRLDYTHLHTIARRASTFQKCGKTDSVVRKNKVGHTLIEIQYLRQATKITLGL